MNPTTRHLGSGFFLEKWRTDRQLLLEMQRVFWNQRQAVSVIGFSSIEECSKKLAEISHGEHLKKIVGEKLNTDLERMVGNILSEGNR